MSLYGAHQDPSAREYEVRLVAEITTVLNRLSRHNHKQKLEAWKRIRGMDPVDPMVKSILETMKAHIVGALQKVTQAGGPNAVRGAKGFAWLMKKKPSNRLIKKFANRYGIPDPAVDALGRVASAATKS